MFRNQQIAKKNAKKIMALVFFVLLSFVSYGQEKIDTIYYDKNWKGMSNRSFADFTELRFILKMFCTKSKLEIITL